MFIIVIPQYKEICVFLHFHKPKRTKKSSLEHVIDLATRNLLCQHFFPPMSTNIPHLLFSSLSLSLSLSTLYFTVWLKLEMVQHNPPCLNVLPANVALNFTPRLNNGGRIQWQIMQFIVNMKCKTFRANLCTLDFAWIAVHFKSNYPKDVWWNRHIKIILPQYYSFLSKSSM